MPLQRLLLKFSLTAIIVALFGSFTLMAALSAPLDTFLLVPSNPVINPLSNTHTIPSTSTVSITYDENIDSGTVSTETFAIQGLQTGLLEGIYTVNGGMITFTPDNPFKPGELVNVSATTGTLSAVDGSNPLNPTVWQFHIAPIGGSGYFQSPGGSFGSGSDATFSLATGDLNGDGYLDLVVGNRGDTGGDTPGAQNTIYFNDGDGTFDTFSQNFGPPDSITYDVTLGDVDGDGDLDIAVGNRNEINQIYFNDGNGTFNTSTDLGSAADRTLKVALGDLDGDSDLDVIVVNTNTTNKIYLNNNNGTFSSAGAIDGQSESTYVLDLGDLDGDGDLDVVIGNFDDQNRAYLNNGDGTFSGSSNFGTGSDDTWSTVLGDMDNDGDLDVVVGNASEQNNVYFNDGDGTFSENSSFGPNNDATRVTLIADFDADGDLDIAVGNRNEENGFYRNNGSGNFVKINSHTEGNDTETYGLATGDFDNDGDLDLAVGDRNTSNLVYFNRGTLHTVAPAPESHTASVTTNLTATTVISLNQSSITTQSVIVYGNLQGKIPGTITTSPTQFTFSPATSFLPGELIQTSVTTQTLDENDASIQPYIWQFRTGVAGGPGKFADLAFNVGPNNNGTRVLAWGDVDNDNDLDLAVGNESEQNVIYINDGNLGFNTTYNFGTGSDRTRSLAFGDMDADGDLDLVVGNEGEQNKVYLNNGDGTFETNGYNFGFSGDKSRSLALGDADGDGDLDIAVGNDNQQNLIYFNNGNGTLTSPGDNFGPTDSKTRGLAFGDVDLDGHLDLILANDAQQNVIYLNDGDGTFTTSPINFGTGSDKSRALAIGDVDLDGDLDIAIGNSTEQNVVYLNNGNGSFAPGGNTFGPGNDDTHAVALGDLDGDNYLDVIVGNKGEQNTLYANNGDGTFNTTNLDFGPNNSETLSLALGDADGDDDLDVIIGNDGGQNAIYLNQIPVDLAISKTASPSSAGAGQTIVYTLAFTNFGIQPATGVIITDIIPTHFSSSTYQSNIPVTQIGNISYTWQIDTLEPNESGTITINAIMGNSPPGTTFYNTATITSSTSEPNMGNNTASVETMVASLNNAPVANDDSGPNYTTDEDNAFNTPNVLANDYDPDGNFLFIDQVNLNGTIGHVVYNGNKTFRYNPNGKFEFLNPTQTVEDSFGYRVSDGLLHDTARVTVTITGVNDAPLAIDDTYIMDEDSGPINLDVLINDSDIDDGDTLVVSDVITPSQGGTIVNEGTNLAYTPPINFYGEESFVYVLQDSGGLTNTGRVTITLLPVNDPPIATDDASSTPQNTSRTIFALGNDSDPDGDTLTLVSTSPATNGSTTIDGNAIIYTPNTGYIGLDNFNYIISDGVFTATARVTVDVGGVNAPPVAVNDVATTVENTSIIIDVLANDKDTDPLTIISVGPTNNSIIVNNTMNLNYTPNNGFVGTDSFTYTISDGLEESTAIVVVQVTAVHTNTVPQFTSTPPNTATAGQPYNYAITTSDIDTDDTLTITAPTKPPWLTLIDNGNRTGLLSGTPNIGDVGEHSVILAVTDGEETSTQNFVVVVITATTVSTNTAPQFSSTPPVVVTAEQLYTYTITITDSDTNDNLTITAPAKPAWLTLTDVGNGTGWLSGTPSINNVGQHPIVLSVTDGQLTTNQSFTITVTSPPITGSINLGLIKEVVGLGQTTNNLPLGSIVTYTISLNNPDEEIATDLLLTDVLPNGITFNNWLVQNTAEQSSNTITWQGVVSPGSNLVLQFTANITTNTSFAGQTITNIANFTSTNAGTDLASASFSVTTSDIEYTLYMPLVLK